MHSATQLVKSSPIEISSGLGQRPAGSLCVASSPKVGVTNCPRFPGAEVFFLNRKVWEEIVKKNGIYKHMYNSEVEMISQIFFFLGGHDFEMILGVHVKRQR